MPQIQTNSFLISGVIVNSQERLHSMELVNNDNHMKMAVESTPKMSYIKYISDNRQCLKEL